MTFCQGLTELNAQTWVIGQNTVLKFNNSGDVQKVSQSASSQFSGSEGVASISDTNGKLLFYTDGHKLFDKNNKVLLNMILPSFGSSSTTQGCIFIPSIENTLHIYMFSISASSGKFYLSVIDTTKGSDSAVVIKAGRLISDSISEQMCAVHHSDKNAIWVTVRNFGERAFYSYLISSNGFDSVPVKSFTGFNTKNSYVLGYMKYSANGKFLAWANNSNNIVQLFSFNNKTGHHKLICTIRGVQDPYGIEFSPNNQFLYVAGYGLVQLDLRKLEREYIASNYTVLFRDSNCSTFKCPISAIQRAPGNVLYFCKQYSDNYIGKITKPDLKGLACLVSDNEVDLLSAQSGEGLPNFIASIFSVIEDSIEIPQDSFEVELGAYGSPFFANVFTPNNDLFNDTYTVDCKNNFIYNFTVYNRWGQIVFQQNNCSDVLAWDGKINGIEAAAGVYFFTCEYSSFEESRKVKNGFFELIR